MADLATMCDRISGLRKVLTLHGYVSNGDGKKPWSSRYTLGTSHVDTRMSDWTAYSSDQEVCTGVDIESLSQFLTGDYESGGGL